MSLRSAPSLPRLVPSLVALAALCLGVPAAAGASAGPAYRFWGYYQAVDGEWQFAQTGPDATNPEDGSVEGWRFATAGPDDPRFPRALPTFDDVCGATEPEPGSKRVAVVIDYGRDVDGPEGAEPPSPRAECAVVPEDASGNDVLAAVAEVRSEQGLTCALDGYPATGCGDPVEALPEGAAAPDEDVPLSGLAGGSTGTSGTAGDGAGGDGSAGDSTDAATTDVDGDTSAAESSVDDATDSGDESNAGIWLGLGALVLVAVIGGAALMRRRGSTE